MTNRMKAIVKTKRAKGVELREIPIPTVSPKEVLIKVKVAGICASDIHVYEWTETVAQANLKLPLILGHEFSGRVVQVGSQVNTLKEGDIVAGETHYPCGKCYQCQTGNQHICSNMGIVGRTINGCFAQYVKLPEICARKIPSSLSFEKGVLLEPLGVATHAVERAKVSGDTVAIFGCGPIGLLAVGVAKCLGAVKIFAISRTPQKLEKALAMGANRTLNSKRDNVVEEILKDTEGVGVGVAIEASGSEEALEQGFGVLRNGGRLAIIGTFQKPVAVDILRNVVLKEIDVLGVFGRRMFNTWIVAEELLSSGKLDVTPIMGKSYPLTEYQDAFAKAISGEMGRVFLVP